MTSKSQLFRLAVQQKAKKCKICKGTFEPRSPTQSVCGFECAVERDKRNKAKESRKLASQERKDRARTRLKLKTRGQWLKEAQAAYNGWIRKRDEGLSCVSCGGFTGKQNAGHYRSVGSAPELRFEPLNCHLQCEKCNTYLSGNLINYRIELIKRIGVDKVEWLEGKHESKKYTIDELKNIRKHYQELKKLI